MKKIVSIFICICLLFTAMIIPVSATEGNSASFSIDSAKARIGREFSIAINVCNNPGIVSAKLAVNYDTDVLELVKVQAGDFAKNGGSTSGAASYGFSKNFTDYPYTINWVDALTTQNITSDGVFATLTFKVKDTSSACTTEISTTFDPNDVFDVDLNNVAFETVNSTVKIVEDIAGDANFDGKVNGRDYSMILQSINGWNVEIDENYADVNGDGKLNGRDYALLLQHINGWGVELK